MKGSPISVIVLCNDDMAFFISKIEEVNSDFGLQSSKYLSHYDCCRSSRGIEGLAVYTKRYFHLHGELCKRPILCPRLRPSRCCWKTAPVIRPCRPWWLRLAAQQHLKNHELPTLMERTTMRSFWEAEWWLRDISSLYLNPSPCLNLICVLRPLKQNCTAWFNNVSVISIGLQKAPGSTSHSHLLSVQELFIET